MKAHRVMQSLPEIASREAFFCPAFSRGIVL